MAPESPGAPGVRSLSDDGDVRGVWGSTRELHLAVGAHLRESRAARSDTRYGDFLKYARRREEEREDAPRAERVSGVARQVKADGSDENNVGPTANAEHAVDHGTRGTRGTDKTKTKKKTNKDIAHVHLSPTRFAKTPVRVGGGFRVGDVGVVDTGAPVDPRQRRKPKPEAYTRWEEVAAALPSATPGSEKNNKPLNNEESDPTLLMLRAVEKAAVSLGVKRCGVWTALGKPYLAEGPVTKTKFTHDIRSTFPTKTRHPDDVESEKVKKRQDSRDGAASRQKQKWANTLAHESAVHLQEQAEVALEKESPLRDVLSTTLGFGDGGDAGTRDAEPLQSPRVSLRSRAAKGRFSRDALRESAARVLAAKHGGGS